MSDDRSPDGVPERRHVVIKGDRTIEVTPAQMDAAKLKMERAKARGEDVDPAVEAIASATTISIPANFLGALTVWIKDNIEAPPTASPANVVKTQGRVERTSKEKPSKDDIGRKTSKSATKRYSKLRRTLRHQDN